MTMQQQFSEREMLICKIGLLQGIKAVDFITREQAIELTEKIAKAHHVSLQFALQLEHDLDQMLGDSTIV
jgi:hypothetical protein|tara:strand:+ start:358 stop:567 length:210 start_codon:yes stop_codon:yes gene_type:complete